MKICGTSIIPIFVTIVFCGIIFVYFNMRLAEVKGAVEKQNRVLTAFITNVQTDIRSGGMMFGAGASVAGAGPSTNASVVASASANHLASDEALQAVKHNEKIVVSDDEDDDDDDDSESEDDSDSESEDDDDDDATIVPEELVTLDSLQSSASMQSSDSMQGSASLQTSVVSLELIPDILPLDFESLPTMQVDSSSAVLNDASLKVIDLDSSTIDISKSDTVIYEQMKVDDLRKVVTDLNLAVKDDAKKLKKPELLALLKSKSS